MSDHSVAPVSVIIPVYNGERYLAAAIKSVLEQTLPAAEIIIVDDGSTDGSAEIARRHGTSLRYLRQANQGPATARNVGVNAAQCEMMAFLDADDLWLPRKLAKQVALLQQQGEGYVVCRFHPLLEPGATWPVGLNRAYYESDPACFIPSGLLFTRATWKQVGPFDPSYRVSDDSEWFFRARKGKIPESLVPEVLVYKRIHEQNLSHRTMNGELLRGLHASLRRTKKG
jgi:glycosyltransferase involved in cell wall biosynthesis